MGKQILREGGGSDEAAQDKCHGLVDPDPRPPLPMKPLGLCLPNTFRRIRKAELCLARSVAHPACTLAGLPVVTCELGVPRLVIKATDKGHTAQLSTTVLISLLDKTQIRSVQAGPLHSFFTVYKAGSSVHGAL